MFEGKGDSPSAAMTEFSIRRPILAQVVDAHVLTISASKASRIHSENSNEAAQTLPLNQEIQLKDEISNTASSLAESGSSFWSASEDKPSEDRRRKRVTVMKRINREGTLAA